jgi:hypothetical protein
VKQKVGEGAVVHTAWPVNLPRHNKLYIPVTAILYSEPHESWHEAPESRHISLMEDMEH